VGQFFEEWRKIDTSKNKKVFGEKHQKP